MKAGEREAQCSSFRPLSQSAIFLASFSLATMVQPTALDTPVKKRQKINQNSFAYAFSQLLDKLELFASFLASTTPPPSPTLLLNQLRTIEEEISKFKQEKPGNDSESGTTRKRKDKLDSLGTLYWNQSIVKDSVGEEESLQVVAECSSISLCCSFLRV